MKLKPVLLVSFEYWWGLSVIHNKYVINIQDFLVWLRNGFNPAYINRFRSLTGNDITFFNSKVFFLNNLFYLGLLSELWLI